MCVCVCFFSGVPGIQLLYDWVPCHYGLDRLKTPERYPVNYYTIYASGMPNGKHAGNKDADTGDDTIHAYV